MKLSFISVIVVSLSKEKSFLPSKHMNIVEFLIPNSLSDKYCPGSKKVLQTKIDSGEFVRRIHSFL